jgi:hypothetical protein
LNRFIERNNNVKYGPNIQLLILLHTCHGFSIIFLFQYSGPLSEYLLKAELPVMDQDRCEGSYGAQKGAFCTDYGEANEDPCQVR